MGTGVKIHMNDEIVHFIPIWSAHTGGDTNIKFEKANVLFIGDFYRNYGYPYIDINNGGSLKGMIDGLDATMKSADANTILVPGHGTLIKRDDIVPYRDMVIAVAEKMGAWSRRARACRRWSPRSSRRPMRRRPRAAPTAAPTASSRRCTRR